MTAKALIHTPEIDASFVMASSDKYIAGNSVLSHAAVYKLVHEPTLMVDAVMKIKYANHLFFTLGPSRSLVANHREASGYVMLYGMMFRYSKSIGRLQSGTAS